ncbi:MAG: GTP-binding protein, partial [Bacteroidota bacterium]
MSKTEQPSSSYLDMELLRFTTAGSVDDGKSTLIGRLLYDSKSIFEDQLDQVKQTSERRGNSEVDLALLTDGLKDEREQGITIDVAYRYFATPKRKFIIADTPGHIQYTRNMVTGASTANVALILIDARNGVVEQTCRHSIIASLLQIPHIVVCVNKMDLVDYNESAFEKIKDDFEDFASKLDVKDVRFIPISALNGDNVVNRSEKMDWYEGSTLLYTLENIHIGSDHNHIDCRFPVQTVIRPQTEEYHDCRGYAGSLAGGVFKPGDEVAVLPSG